MGVEELSAATGMAQEDIQQQTQKALQQKTKIEILKNP